jgi:hypothetical protein
MKILERISSAGNSGNLKSEPGTTWSDADVLGASGLAARCNPLGGALVRLFADGKPESAIPVLTHMAFKRARTMRVELTDTGCADMAKAVLGWHRFGTCQPCGGVGYQRIPGTPSLGLQCTHCRGTGKRSFDDQFNDATLPLARWLSDQIDREQRTFGGEAMAKLAPKLEF